MGRKEYRFVLPISYEEYQVAQLYAVAKLSSTVTAKDTGVEVFENKTIDHPIYGMCQYTRKRYYMANKLPRALSMILPSNMTVFDEEAWNAYPFCKTVITSPAFSSDRVYVNITSFHAPGNCTLKNPHNLPLDELEKIEVITPDIGNDKPDYKAADEFGILHDPSVYTFKNEKVTRGPWKGDWMPHANPVMTCYKLVDVKFAVFGFQTIAESKGYASEQNMLTTFHQSMICMMDQWINLTMEDIRKLEDETQVHLAKKLIELGLKKEKSRA